MQSLRNVRFDVSNVMPIFMGWRRLCLNTVFGKDIKVDDLRVGVMNAKEQIVITKMQEEKVVTGNCQNF